MTEQNRKHPRKRVHLKVAYSTAQEFVEQYAVNLSAGGLFISDAEVEMGEAVSITIELPGHGSLTLKTEVAHVSPAGAGLKIQNGPPGYEQVLEEYLMRLGRRATGNVYVDEEPWRSLITDAGYGVRPVPAVKNVRVLFQDLKPIAIMPVAAEAEAYAKALEAYGADPELVIPIHPDLPVDPVLAWLDERLLA